MPDDTCPLCMHSENRHREGCQVGELRRENERLKENQRPKWSRKCGSCGHEQLKVGGEWHCKVCEQRKKINDLGAKFGKEQAALRLRMYEDSRARSDELQAERDEARKELAETKEALELACKALKTGADEANALEKELQRVKGLLVALLE